VTWEESLQALAGRTLKDYKNGGMEGVNFDELAAIDRLHGLEWFWVRTLWEIKNQPVAWSMFMLIVLGLIVGVAVVIVHLTSPRNATEEELAGPS